MIRHAIRKMSLDFDFDFDVGSQDIGEMLDNLLSNASSIFANSMLIDDR
jgi:hypothetical protein